MENVRQFLFGVLGIVTIGLVILVLVGKKVPFIEGYREATIALAILGFLLCTFGSIMYTVTKDPAGPLTIIAYVLGLAGTIIGVMTLMNKKVPFIPDHRTSFLILILIIALKFILARVHGLFLK